MTGAGGEHRDVENEHPNASGASPVIVAIGASAGGISALQTLFETLPKSSTGAAFVVVVHLDPQFPSNLASILAARTSMTVVQVGEPTQLQADHVYVIPPDRRLEIIDGDAISTAEFQEPRGRRAPIDLFLRSLAERLGDGIAVILTGAGSDGASGVKAVKESGGIILVQDPAEAEHASMPRNAIATGVVDFVLPLRELSARIIDLVRVKQRLPAAPHPAFDESALRQVLAHLRTRTGHDFSKYKRSTVLRRIRRRMQVTRADGINAYFDILRANAEEARALLNDLLISVTTFFRDHGAFDVLRSRVIAPLFAAKDLNEPIRVWVPGCATGEEAYTIAILLLEEAARHDARPPIQVFGSDLDGRALNTAREGRYPAAIDADVSDERLRRYFVHEGESYRVRQELRDVVLFAAHSVLKDPPFSRLDLISCRNLLIYLDRDLQEQVCGTFYYALNPGGFLLLGSSENADSPPGLFRTVERNARIYQSTLQPGGKPRPLPALVGSDGVHDQARLQSRPVSRPSAASEAVLHRKAIEFVAPPSILVDDMHRVVHMSGSVGRYVQPSGGPLTGDVVDLVRSELRFELRSALHRAFEQRQSTLTLPILVRFNGAPHRVHVQVKPAAGPDDGPLHALVMFIEGEAVELPTAVHDQDATNETVRRLTEELELTQARLRTTREESESANEELRAANEELQSINEEYRSTSEELETSKEELQSINEELQTVNSELKLKLESVSRAHSDLQNLMAATDVGTLFLDTALRIKRFTAQVTALFSITGSDEGRPITDFAHQLKYDDLVKDAKAVLAQLTPLRRELQSRSDRWFDVRLRPYRTVDDKIDGVVITFLDISERLRVEEALRASEQQLKQQKRLVELSHAAMFIWEVGGGIVDWNRGSEELYGFSADEALGRDPAALLATEVPGSSWTELTSKLQETKNWNGELTQRTKSGRLITIESRLEFQSFEGRQLVLETPRDVTERKLMEARQQILQRELTHRVKNTLAVVQAIASQTLRSSRSNADFVQRFEGRLAALASAHDLLLQSNWRGADLASLARHQLEPYAVDNIDRVHIEGEPIILPADLATPFGLALHELATNAAKYGALSHPGGHVEVTWAMSERNRHRVLAVTWREKGGPKAKQLNAAGLGTMLIEHGIPNAKVERQFLPDGLLCTIEVTLSNVGDDGPPDPP